MSDPLEPEETTHLAYWRKWYNYKYMVHNYDKALLHLMTLARFNVGPWFLTSRLASILQTLGVWSSFAVGNEQNFAEFWYSCYFGIWAILNELHLLVWAPVYVLFAISCPLTLTTILTCTTPEMFQTIKYFFCGLGTFPVDTLKDVQVIPLERHSAVLILLVLLGGDGGTPLSPHL